MITESQVQEGINRFWDARGRSYDAQPGHGLKSDAERRAWLEFLDGVCPPPPSAVLDLGTGTGFLALLLASRGHRVVGLDLAEGMLETAIEKSAGLAPNSAPTWVLGDANRPPFPRAIFDAVVSRHVLWTLTAPSEALERWFQMLRPEGRLIIIDGLWWADSNPDEIDRSASMDEELRDHWEEAYGAQARVQLPLMLAKHFDPITTLVTEAGFQNVQVQRLDEVERLEREASPEQDTWWSRYAIVARRPG